MKQILKKCFLLTFCLVFIGVAGISVKASERIINTDNEWISGSLTNDVQYYKFTIPTAGEVTYTFQSYSDDGECQLLDKDLVKEYGYVDCDGSSASPATKSGTHDMEAGTYYLKICINWSYAGDKWTGDYRVKVSFAAANNNETEPNNNFAEAMPLLQQKMVTGYITDDDSLDFYKFTITTAQTVEIIWTNKEYLNFGVWDSDYLAVKDDYDYDSGTHTWEKYLQPGTYYIKFERFVNHTGLYTVKYHTKQYISKINLKQNKVVLNKGASYNMLSSITPSTATNKVLNWSSSNSDVVTVSTSGKVTAKRVGYVWITAESTDGSEVKAESVVIVKPGKAKIKKLEVPSNDNHRINVYFKAMSGVSGYQVMRSQNKNFIKKTVYSTGSDTEGIYYTNLQPKKRYYIKFRAYVEYDGKKYYGAWSDVKSIKTKK